MTAGEVDWDERLEALGVMLAGAVLDPEPGTARMREVLNMIWWAQAQKREAEQAR